MSSGKQFQLFKNLLTTPQRHNRVQSTLINSSRNFSSSFKHRKPIFKQSPHNTTGKKPNKTHQIFIKQPLQHYQIKNIVSDDFCGCQTTLQTCKRIKTKYFDGISLNELKTSYQLIAKPNYPISSSSKKVFLNQLPIDFPQIYHSQLTNILDHFQQNQITNQSFILLAWIQFHCKFQSISYYFYSDLKNSFIGFNFLNKLELELIKYNINYYQAKHKFKNSNLQIDSFLKDFCQSVGSIVIPFTQYAKFLEILKSKGQKVLVQLMGLFIAKKQKEFYDILKFWTYNQIQNLRRYSRFLNWDLFFQQIQSNK